MYGLVLMVAMSAAPETAACGHACGCYGGGYGGCYGGGYGYGGYGGGFGYGGGYGSGFGYGGGGYGYAGGFGYGGGYGVWGGRIAGGGYAYSAPTNYGSTPAYSGGYANVAGPATTSVPASYSSSTQTRAVLEVRMPANANLFVESKPVISQGGVRRFSTPVLEKNKEYSYLVTATLMRDNKEMKVEKKVIMRAGQTSEVFLDFAPEIAAYSAPNR